MTSTHKLSLLICCDEYPPKEWGGLSRSLEAIVEGLLLQACRIDVLSHRRADYVTECLLEIDFRRNYRVYWCRYPLCQPEDLVRALNVYDYDIVYVNGRGFAEFAIYLSTNLDKSIVYSSRSDYYEESSYVPGSFSARKARLQDAIISASDLILVAGHSEMARVASRYSLPPQKTRYLPNPLHPIFFHERAALPIRQERILFVGRYITGKGVHHLLNAMPKILARKPQTRFLFVGGHGEEQVVRLLQEAQANFPLNLEVKDWLALPDLVSEYFQSEIVVIPSLYETFGNVALEAMACGCTVVASSVGGLAELIENRETGLLVPPADSDAIAIAVLDLLENQAFCKYLGSRAAKRVRRDFSYSKIAAMFYDILIKQVGGR